MRYFEFNGVDGEIKITDDAKMLNIFDDGGSVEFIINPNSDGEGNGGRVVDKSANNTKGYRIVTFGESGGNVKIFLSVFFSGAQGAWEMDTAEVPIGSDSHFVMTFDSSDSSNNPIFYLNGSTVAFTETSSPSGTLISDTGTDLILGNRADGANTFDGGIVRVRLGNRILSSSEVTDFYNGAPVVFADQEASQTALLTGNDVSDPFNGNWASYSGATLTVNNGTGNPAPSAEIASEGAGNDSGMRISNKLTVGLRYRLQFDARRVTAVDFTIFGGGTPNAAAVAAGSSFETNTLTDSFVTFSGEFIAESTSLIIGEQLSAVRTYLVDNITLVRIGVVAEYLPEGIGGAIWEDSSGNSLDGTVSGANAFVGMGGHIFGRMSRRGSF